MYHLGGKYKVGQNENGKRNFWSVSLKIFLSSTNNEIRRSESSGALKIRQKV